MWGATNYGKLGFDAVENQLTPIMNDSLLDQKVINVSCGLNHTVVSCHDGKVFAFGQGKYYKLGYGELDSSFIPRQLKIQSKRYAPQVCARNNLSMAICGPYLYTWGYSGMNLLGRRFPHDESSEEEDEEGEKRERKQRIRGKLPDFIKCQMRVPDPPSAEERKFATKINQVAMGAVNIAVLMNSGALFMFGTDTYKQLGKPDSEVQAERKKRIEDEVEDVKYR